jgi:hypothetical protein
MQHLILCALFLLDFQLDDVAHPSTNANTVNNENKPSDAREVLAYYNREQ